MGGAVGGRGCNEGKIELNRTSPVWIFIQNHRRVIETTTTNV